jgi:hypothetical protein
MPAQSGLMRPGQRPRVASRTPQMRKMLCHATFRSTRQTPSGLKQRKSSAHGPEKFPPALGEGGIFRHRDLLDSR